MEGSEVAVKLLRINVALSAAVFCAAQSIAGAPYADLVPRYDRLVSNVMARHIERPTLANLDYAAYVANPMLVEEQPGKFKKPPADAPLETITFGGCLAEVKNRLDQTPLSGEEKAAPLAWRPLVKKLWSTVKERRFQAVTASINGYKWADSSVYQAYQEITCAYVHRAEDSVQLWVKIEFNPWAGFLQKVRDEDKDGYKEVYGRLNLGGIPADTLKKAFEWIGSDYCGKILTKEEITDWATDLASYWYPTKNTDIVDLHDSAVWPDGRTEARALKTMAGARIHDPVAVIRGKPFLPDRPIYNVFTVGGAKGGEPSEVKSDTPSSPMAPGTIDNARAAEFWENEKQWAAEVALFGDYGKWNAHFNDFRSGLRKYLGALPVEQKAFAGKDGWLFLRKSAEFLFSGDLTGQQATENPLPHIAAFNEYLKKRNVNMLFVPVPGKEEVYPEKLPQTAAMNAHFSPIHPYARKFLRDLQDADVEVVDLLPVFLAAKEKDAASNEPLYQPHDTHWTTRGLRLAAEKIAGRIKHYSWYGALPKAFFTALDTATSRMGDLVDKLPEKDRQAMTPAILPARQIRMPGNIPYRGSDASPLMLIGDSFTGVFESVDCKSAGVGANIAEKCSLGVEIVTSWGGGPLVRKKAIEPRENNLGAKRLVIYLMADRDLYKYSMGWKEFPEKGK